MALAFLPSTEIAPTFARFKQLIENDVPILMPYMEYFSRQWIDAVQPSVWCVHGCSCSVVATVDVITDGDFI